VSMYNVRSLVNCALLTAFSLVFELFFAFPILPSMPFLLYAPGDFPILFITYVYGLVPGIIAVLINATLFVIIRPPDAFPLYGLAMHILASTAFISVFYLFAQKRKLIPIIIGLVLGTMARALVMVPANLWLTPYYLKATFYPDKPMDEISTIVKSWIIPGIIPFNLLHSGINSILFFLVRLALGDRLSSSLLKK